MLGRVIGGLIVVLVLVALAAKVARRTRGANGDSGLRIVERIGLSREANLAVVEVASRKLLLGVTAQNVTILADLDDAGDRDTRPVRVDVSTGPDLTAVAAGLSSAKAFLTGRLRARRGLPGSASASITAEPEPFEPISAISVSDLTEAADAADSAELQLDETTQNADRLTPLPTTVALDQHPDLASALRAAGRTSQPTGLAAEAPTLLNAPRTRAEARAQRAAAESTSVRPEPAPQLGEDAGGSETARHEVAGQETARHEAAGREAARREIARQEIARRETPIAIPAPRPPSPPTPRPTQQASGSVLSPKTWHQGIEALRELTIRRN
jgi:flagellar protein FliO/FliZ